MLVAIFRDPPNLSSRASIMPLQSPNLNLLMRCWYFLGMACSNLRDTSLGSQLGTTTFSNFLSNVAKSLESPENVIFWAFSSLIGQTPAWLAWTGFWTFWMLTLFQEENDGSECLWCSSCHFLTLCSQESTCGRRRSSILQETLCDQLRPFQKQPSSHWDTWWSSDKK